MAKSPAEYIRQFETALLAPCSLLLALFLIWYIAERKEWKVAPDLIKTKSNKPKRLKEGKEGGGRGGGREEQRNRENLSKGATTRTTKPGSGKSKKKRSKFSGEEFFTFSLDGLIPPYGHPSQVHGP